MKSLTKFLTVKEIASILRVDRETVYREIRSERIQAHYMNGSYRVLQSALDAYIANSAGQKRPKRVQVKVEAE